MTDCILNASDPTDPQKKTRTGRTLPTTQEIITIKNPKRKGFLLNSPRENL
jgi:hypothetical protein